MSDVTFVVGRGNQVQRIPAHKFVLSVGSAVFDAMFNSTLATRDEEIELPGILIILVFKIALQKHFRNFFMTKPI